MSDAPPVVHLVTAHSSLLLTLDDAVPRLIYWGPPLPASVDGSALDRATAAAIPLGGLDSRLQLSLLPEQARGVFASPGVLGHRAGQAWAPLLSTMSAEVRGTGLTWTGCDAVSGVEVTLVIDLDESGVLAINGSLTNLGSDAYTVEQLAITLPLPTSASEVLTLSGRWSKEFQQLRRPLMPGAIVAENQRGRTSHESSPTIFVGSAGFSESVGEVVGVHLAWSGNHRLRAERMADGRSYLQAHELLRVGDVVLAPGETYTAPALYAVRSDHGLTPASQSFHAFVRSWHQHPNTARKVLLNTWEAVYFDHDLPGLKALADAAAAVGVERFVLDDGWFRGRADDSTSLGDWYVDESKYPDGLAPLVDYVCGLGMDFGLWVEPEMVNPDSDLYRAHPDWAIAVDGHPALLARQQLVLDLGRDEVFAYLLERLDSLLSEFAISYVKWDMNRDLLQANVHRQTTRLYELLAELGRRHPTVEIESCSSGGARVDLGVLRHTRRVWTSDCNDALERQWIQRGCSLVVPPELMGAHIGPTKSHTTGRVHDLGFRAATALFGHLGLEWDLCAASEADLAGLTDIISLYKHFRPLLHSGLVVRGDHPDPAALVHGVVAADGSEALFCYAQIAATASTVPLLVQFPGLDPARTYQVDRVQVPGSEAGPQKALPAWYDNSAEPLILDGATLTRVGVALAVHRPESATLLYLRAV